MINANRVLARLSQLALVPVLAVTFSSSALLFSDNSYAAKAKEPTTQRKTKRVQTVSAKNAKNFQKISDLFEANQDAEAKVLLDQMSAKEGLNNFEKAYIANFLGAYYFERDDLNGALREFKKIIANPEGVPEGFYTRTFYTIAQIYFSKEDYKSALDYAQRWFKTTEDPPADAYMLIGQAYYQLKQYGKALPNVKKGIQKYIDVGSVPKEGWLNLLSSIYRQKNQYKEMLPVIKQLVQHYPKKTYLLTLGGVYNELDDQKKMTGIYQALYDQGLMSTQSELVTLASLLLSQDNPYKAAMVIEKGLEQGVVKKEMKNYRLYAQALMMAKDYEKALTPLKKAAAMAKDGKLYNQLGQSYVSLNRWKEAEAAFNKGLKKGKLQNTGQTLLSLGLAQFEQKKFSSAKATFVRASKNKDSAKAANNWIKYVDNEVYRIKELEKPIVINTDPKA